MHHEGHKARQGHQDNLAWNRAIFVTLARFAIFVA
jgi:hypothetical protein